MGSTPAVAVAIITVIGSVVVGYFTLRASVKITAAKEKADENTIALEAWKELVQPLRDENQRLVKQIEQQRLTHAAELEALELRHRAELAAQELEHTAVLAALEPLNDKLRRESDEQPDGG